MAFTSSSSVKKSLKYDVFLSFMSKDTRWTFVDHLYHALHDKGMITYKDDENIVKGERIIDQLLPIEESRFHIVVFSTNYASSSRCLDELVRIMECQRTIRHTAIPIFYDVEPTEVGNQSGAVGEAFAKLVEKKAAGSWRDVEPKEVRKQSGAVGKTFARHETEEVASRWRNALKEAANLPGWELNNTFQGEKITIIQKIVHFVNFSIDEKLVGMETRVEKVVSSLEIGFEDIRMIGIKGMGGSGKTALARTIFNQKSNFFEGKSFVNNVREFSKASLSGLIELQKKVLSDVLNDQSIGVKDDFDGEYMMKQMMPSRKVLLVLDDVDAIDQLEALAGERSWFKPGSRIIITTRNEQVLKAQQVDFIHDVDLLSDKEAISLFSRCVFGAEIPLQGYEMLSEIVVDYAAGLPLTIKLLASFLLGRTQREWEKILKRLETVPLKEILDTLELSYNGLEDDQKEIFLDVACILKGEMKDKAIRVLESCGYDAEIGLRVLEQKSLITISDDGRLLLHNHLAELGRHIVCRVHHDAKKHNRLWIKDEIEDILVSGLVRFKFICTEATRSIKLLNTNLSPDIIMKGLRKMNELRLLYVDNGYKNDVYASQSNYNYVSLPNSLQYLYWRAYPLSCLPETFQANNLVNLEMPRSNISKLWEGRGKKVLEKLRFLDLSFSRLITFDLEVTPRLERLDLRGCNEFVALIMSDECQNLEYLNLSGSKLLSLNLWQIPNLITLDLSRCNKILELQMPLRCPKLKFLNLTGFKLNDSFNLHLKRSESLEELTLSVKNIKYLPESICMLKCLKSLELKSCLHLAQLPKDLGRLECLNKLILTNCIFLLDIPSSICNIKCLEYLHLTYCSQVKNLPEELGRLESLKDLNIEGTAISHLPQSVYRLKGLRIVWSKAGLKSHGFTSLTEISRYTAFYVLDGDSKS